MSRLRQPEWLVMGQMWHAVVEHRTDDEGELFVRTVCNTLIWPSVLDARKHDAVLCLVCADLHPVPDSLKPVPELAGGQWRRLERRLARLDADEQEEQAM